MRITAAALVFVSAWLSSPPAHAADAAAGERLARAWCAACHLVAADQERVPTVAPPFASIARKPGFDREQLTRSMQFPHPQMPGRELDRDQAADIAAYIASLAR